MGWEDGFSRRKLFYREWINIKVPLYSTRNYIQYPVITYNGKESEKEHTHTRTTESLCCIPETNTTH